MIRAGTGGRYPILLPLASDNTTAVRVRPIFADRSVMTRLRRASATTEEPRGWWRRRIVAAPDECLTPLAPILTR